MNRVYRAVLLTGRPGVGKTTVVREVARRLAGFRLAGFYTAEMRDAGRRVGFEAVTLDGERSVIAHVDLATGARVGRYGVDVAAIDRLAAAALAADPEIELYVIDEIGKMECLSERFVAAVRGLLARRAWVVATVARAGRGLIAEAKARSDAIVREVTLVNRDELAAKIAPWLAARLRPPEARRPGTG